MPKMCHYYEPKRLKCRLVRVLSQLLVGPVTETSVSKKKMNSVPRNLRIKRAENFSKTLSMLLLPVRAPLIKIQ
jgi:hypothetical protein